MPFGAVIVKILTLKGVSKQAEWEQCGKTISL